MSRLSAWMILFCVFLVASQACGEAIIREEQESPGARLPDADDKIEARYDRFPQANPTSKSFRWKHVDWSGVGKGVGAPQWGTLIAPQFFVSAAHARPRPGKRLRFYSGPDPSVAASARAPNGFRDGEVGQVWTISHENGKAADLVLGACKQPVNVAYYPIFVRPTIMSDGGNEMSGFVGFEDEMVQVGQAAVSTVDVYYDRACSHAGNNSTSQPYPIPFWFKSKKFVKVRINGKAFKDFRVEGAGKARGGRLFTNVPIKATLEIGQLFEDGSVLHNAAPAAQKMGTNKAAKGYASPGRINFLFDELDNPAEFMPRRSTSGAPSLVLVDGRAAIAGVHSGVEGFNLCHFRMDQPLANTETNADGTYKRGPRMYDVAVCYFRNQLQRQMAAVQVAVPEHERQVLICYTMDQHGKLIPGDYNGDFVVDQKDADIMIREVNIRKRGRFVRGYNWYLDWNQDRRIDRKDENYFFSKVMRKRKGDVDLNGMIDQTDLSIVQSHLHRRNSDYAHGDLNGDGTTDFQDQDLWREEYARKLVGSDPHQLRMASGKHRSATK